MKNRGKKHCLKGHQYVKKSGKEAHKMMIQKKKINKSDPGRKEIFLLV